MGWAMALTGGYLLLNQITVRTGYWRLWGYNASGLTFIPFVIGVGFDSARLATIFPQPHDIRLDLILTEAGVRSAEG